MTSAKSGRLAEREALPMNDDGKKMYTVRLPERIAERLEASAVETGTTPINLIRSLIVRSFDSSGTATTTAPAARTTESQRQATIGPGRDSELKQEERHRQLLYEIGRTRAALLHSLDHTLDADTVDDIIEAAEKTAAEYVADLLRARGGAT
jgi:cysteine synthase